MFSPKEFLQPPTFQITPAARMVLTHLEQHGISHALHTLQSLHMGNVRHDYAILNGREGAFLSTHFDFDLRVIDCIVPDDYVRRTFICVDTELFDIRHRIFLQSGFLKPKPN